MILFEENSVALLFLSNVASSSSVSSIGFGIANMLLGLINVSIKLVIFQEDIPLLEGKKKKKKTP